MPKRILIIDDDVLVLKTAKRVLEQNGFLVEIAKSGEAGIEKIKTDQFNLIICDVRMPEMDGIMTLKRIKTEMCQKAKDIPVIFITGYASEETPIDAIKLGAKDYILKPFDLDELLSSVKKHLS